MLLANVLATQVLFATDWPVMPHTRVLAEWQSIGLPPAALAAVLGGNAAAVYGFAADDAAG